MKLRVSIETKWVGASEVEEVEIDDNATQEEIEETARELFFEYCSYWFEVIE
ncbi:MAG: hypothetical protein RSC43_00705 [Clostridia bacterium]